VGQTPRRRRRDNSCWTRTAEDQKRLIAMSARRRRLLLLGRLPVLFAVHVIRQRQRHGDGLVGVPDDRDVVVTAEARFDRCRGTSVARSLSRASGLPVENERRIFGARDSSARVKNVVVVGNR